MVSLLDQLHALALTALGGVLMGVLFDGLRVVRGLAPRSGVLSWLLDLLYWVVLAPLLAVVLLQANWGELRLYVLLGIGSGLALYFAFCSRLVLAVLSALTRGFVVLLAGVARLLWGVVIWPAILLRSAVYATGADRWGRAGREPIGRDRPGQDRAGAGSGRWPSPRPWSWRLPRLLPGRLPLSLPWRPGLAWRRR